MSKKVQIDCVCEMMEDPIGIDCPSPRFSWMSDSIVDQQKAYRLMVSQWKEMEFPVWDSGIVNSSQSHLVPYEGERLESGTRYYYQVTIICENAVYTSGTNKFFTGIVEERDWDPFWIGGAGVRNHSYLIRWPVKIRKPVKTAAAFVASPNYYLLSLNGRLCRDVRLNNARTEYSKTMLYETYPLRLEQGENVLGIEIGNGWHALELGERGIAKGEHIVAVQVRIEFEDHTVEWYGSSPDNCFYTDRVPDIRNSIYGGETYDARLEQAGWDSTGFFMTETMGWHRVFQQDSPGGIIRSQMMEPIRVMEEIKPKEIYESGDGSYTVDFGQNFAGWMRLMVWGERGRVISMRFAELMNEDCSVNECSLNGNHAVDCYICKGEGTEIFEPRFTYHGFRYVQITGLDAKPASEHLTGCVVYSSVKYIGGFHSDNNLLNRFYQSVIWSEKSNLYSVPTDCPQRAERVGWLNDMTVRNECALYNFRLPQFYRKWMGDIRDTQGNTSGAISDTAPFCRMGQKPADPVSTSFLLIPWNVYCLYGDRKILEENYEACKRWVSYLDRHSDNGIVRYSPMGDWASPKKWCDDRSIGAGAVSRITPTVFMATGFQYYNYVLLGKMAKVLGEQSDVCLFEKKARKVKTAFMQHFYNSRHGYFCNNSQGCNVFPLYLHMLQHEEEQQVLEHLLKDIMETNKCHLTTGNLCSRYVVETLFQYGYADEAFALLTQTSYPSWGYMFEHGATTMWERWEMVESYEGYSKMASFNHAMTGAVGVCFHKYLAGIRADENEPGFQNAIIRPVIPRKLRHVEGKVESIHGNFKCRWEFESDNRLKMAVQIPFNCTADIYLPVGWCSQAMVMTGGISVTEEFEKVSLDEGDYLHRNYMAGRYAFEVVSV